MSEVKGSGVSGTTRYYRTIRFLSFPSLSRIVLYLLAVNVGGSILAFALLAPRPESISTGLVTGLGVVALPSMGIDAALRATILRRDPLFFLRRCLALSFLTSSLWVLFIILGVGLKVIFAGFDVPKDALLLGLFAILPLRMVALISMSSVSLPGRFVASIVQPAGCLLAASGLVGLPAGQILVALTAATVTGFLTSTILVLSIEREGVREIGFSPIQMFKAFLMDWLELRSDNIERYLEDLGVNRQVKISLIQFRALKTGKRKGVLVISNFHPGPFLNVGSSILPYLIQRTVEKLTGAVTAVPHGVSGHELNLVSQRENEVLLHTLIRMLEDAAFHGGVTRLVRATVPAASATCQVMGEHAVVTLTTSPHEMEDVPLDTEALLTRDASPYFRKIAFIDSHNSICEGVGIRKEHLEDLVEASRLAVEKAGMLAPATFRFGASKIIPSEFGLREGVGPCGLVTFILEGEGQKAAYLLFDANNMISGLREKILETVGELGISECEALTTDTHMVNGVVRAKLGYHPLGESLDIEALLLTIRRGVESALSDLEECEVASATRNVAVKTLGADTFSGITSLIHKTSQRTAATLLLSISLTLIAVLATLV